MASYLDDYANHFDLDIRLNHKVLAVQKVDPNDKDSGYKIKVNGKDSNEVSPKTCSLSAITLLTSVSPTLPTSLLI